MLSFDELHATLAYQGEEVALQEPPIVLVDLASDPAVWNSSSLSSLSSLSSMSSMSSLASMSSESALPASSTTGAGLSPAHRTTGFLSTPCVFVGVGDEALLGQIGAATALIDVVAAKDSDLEAIDAAARRCPIASVSLALLLRGRETRSLDEALVAESTTYSMLQSGPEFAAWRSSHKAKSPVADREPPVNVFHEGSVLYIELNRPTRHNAYSTDLRDALVAAFDLAIADEELRVVLRGNGPSFCSGGELTEFGSFIDPASAHRTRLTRSAARQLLQISNRVTAHVHGFCLGAGIELAAFAHAVIAHPETTFALPELALGLVPGSGGTASLPPRIGRHRSALLALTGRRITAKTALDWGLIDAID